MSCLKSSALNFPYTLFTTTRGCAFGTFVFLVVYVIWWSENPKGAAVTGVNLSLLLVNTRIKLKISHTAKFTENSAAGGS